MLTATEAKIASYRSKGYSIHVVDNKIVDATKEGKTECAINISELPNGTPGMLCEISFLLIELGYKTTIADNTLNVYWSVQKPLFYDILGDIEYEEDNEW